jgi:hypothetical protein
MFNREVEKKSVLAVFLRERKKLHCHGAGRSYEMKMSE